MRTFQVPGQSDPRPPQGLQPGERRKIIAMAVGVLMLFGAFLYSRMRQDSFESEEMRDLPAASMQESIRIPEIDSAKLEGLISDTDRMDRVVLETEPLDLLMADARKLTPRHFEAMQAKELGQAEIDAIMADPSQHRGAPLFARGLIDSIRTRQRGTDTEHIGRLRLDDDSFCYFLTLEAPSNGGYVRVDGLFLKTYSDENEVEPGEWIDGPLLVGPKAQRSYRALGETTTLLTGMFADVDDAAVVDETGQLLPPEQHRFVQETPFEPLWHLMAYARDLPEGEIDWDAAPEIDNEVLQGLMKNPDDWRLQPVRIPISRVQDGRVLAMGENPARIESITQGWMGNSAWQNVVKFMSPTPNHAIQLKDYAYGHGFFLHNFAYPAAGGGMRIAPLVVMVELNRFENTTDPLWAKLGIAFGIFTVALIIGFGFLLLRDRKRSAQLQKDMVRRRRARSERANNQPTAGQPTA